MINAPSKSKYFYFLGLFPLLCLVIYIWVWGLEDFYFVLDNAIHLVLAKEAGWNVVEHLRREPHPPLFYAILKLFMEIFGTRNPLMLRACSLLAGILAVVVSYFFGKKLTGSHWVGFVVAYLLVTSPLVTSLSQALRNYSLLLFLLLSIFLCLQEEKPVLKHWIVLAFLILLSTFTHYSSILLLPSYLFLFFSKPITKWHKIKQSPLQLVWVFFLIANAFLTYGMVMIRPDSTSGEDTHIASLKSVVGQDIFRLGPVLWFFLKEVFGNNTSWLVACLGGWGFIRLIVERKRDLIILTVGPVLIGILFSLTNSYPMTSERHSIYLVPSILIAIIWGLKWFKIKNSASIAIIFALILGTQFFSDFNVYKIKRDRDGRFFELGPRFSELKSVKSKLMQNGPNETIIFDASFYSGIWMEKILKPEWSIFLDVPQKLESSPIWFGINEPKGRFCTSIQKLTKEYNRTKFLLFLRKEQTSSFRKYALADNHCYQIRDEIELSPNFVIVPLKSISN